MGLKMHRKKSHRSSFSSIILIPAVVIIILIDKPDYRFFDFVYKITMPAVEYVGHALGYPARLVGTMFANFREQQSILRESEQIAVKLDNFHWMQDELRFLRAENIYLRDLLSKTKEIPQETVIANITRNNSFGERQSFVIQRPDYRVRAGNVVISSRGQFLGIITESTRGFARIRSARDGNFNIPVRFAGTDVFGFLHGRGGNNDPELRFLSDDKFTPNIGSFLVTSSVNGNLPNGIPVGEVSSINGYEIRVRMGSDLRNQKIVKILLFDGANIYNETF